MLRIPFLAVLFLALHVQAQNPPIKFGDVSMDEVQMNGYPPDSSAVAVVLADYGESSIQYNQTQGFILLFERVTRTKILRKEGYDWANFEILLYTGSQEYREKLSSLKVVTYNLVNSKIEESKASNSAIFQEEYNKDFDVVRVAAPNVREGSVVEITYRIQSDYLVNLQDWTFQSTIPVIWSEYRTRIPDFFHYDKYMQGYVVPFLNEEKAEPRSLVLTFKERTYGSNSAGTQFSQEKIDYKEHSMRLVAKDVPAFKSEPFITTYKDYLSKINFELAYIKFPDQPVKPVMGTWDDISKKLWAYTDFGGEIGGNGFLKKIVESIIIGAETPEEKIGRICKYVRTNVSWNGQNRMLSSGALKKVLDERKGTSADINLLLGSMLDKAGLTVYPVLLSTRDHGFVRENIPMLSQFNYSICLVTMDGKQVLLDATDKFLPPGVLPEKCLNGQGMVVNGQHSVWVKLEPKIRSRTVVDTELRLGVDGEMKCEVKFSLEGYPAFSKRQSYLANGEEEHVKQFLEGKSWVINEKHFENVENISEPFRELYQVTIDDQLSSGENVLYIRPMMLNQGNSNPFKLVERAYPVDFGSPFEKVFIFKVEVPSGYKIDELPEPKMIMLPGNAARFIFSSAQNGNTVNITSMLSINKAIYTQLEYPNLREFYNQVVAKQEEQIILKKEF